MQLGAHNAEAVVNTLIDLMASCGEAIKGITGNAQASQVMAQPPVIVPNVIGSRASFVDPRAEAQQKAAKCQRQTRDGLQDVLNAAATLNAVLSAKPPGVTAEPSGKPLALVQ